MTDQLRRDLIKRIHERLHQWASDSADLYDMAGEPTCHAFEDIFFSVLEFMVRGTIILKLDENQFAALVVKMIRIERQQLAKKEGKEG